MASKTYTDQQKQEAVALFLSEGATVAASAVGCSRQAIYGWLALYGVDTDNDEEKRQATAARHAEKRSALAEAFLDQSMTLALAADAEQPLDAQRLMTAAAIASQKHLELIAGQVTPGRITMGQIESEIARMEGELGNENDLDRSLRQSIAEMERRIRSDYEKEMSGRDKLGRVVGVPKSWDEVADSINGDRPPTEGA